MSSSSSYDSDESEEYEPPSTETLDRYNTLMSSLLPPIPPALLSRSQENKQAENGDESEDEQTIGGKPLTKAERQNAKKKRRKERERLTRLAIEAQQQPSPTGIGGSGEQHKNHVDFKLFSSYPIQSINLSPASEKYETIPNPRLRPLPFSTVERIRRIGKESAVDLPTLGGPFISSEKWTKTNRPTRILRSSDPISSHSDSYNHVMKLEIARQDYINIEDLDREISKAKPEIQITDPNQSHRIPSLSILDSLEIHESSVVKRKRMRRTPYAHPPPRFWAPPAGLGGKSRGYAWGYWDSLEGRREDGFEGYVRSRNR